MASKNVGGLAAQDAFVQSVVEGVPKAVILGGVEQEYEGRNVRSVVAFPYWPKEGAAPHFLRLLFTASHPRTLPLIAFQDLSWFLLLPHVERDGVLCVPAAGATFNGGDYLTAVHEVIQSAIRLISKCEDEDFEGEFRREFPSYWNIECNTGYFAIANLRLGTSGGSVPSAWTAGHLCLAENNASLLRLLKVYTPSITSLENSQPSFIVKLSDALLPSEFPTSGKGVAELLVRSESNLSVELDQFIQTEPGAISIIFVMESASSWVYAGVRLLRNDNKLLANRGSRQFPGFRRGKVPIEEQRRRYFGMGTKVHRFNVKSISREVTCSRERSEDAVVTLESRTVAVVGCGSVGSHLADGLVKAGVGHLVLVDHDTLESENLSRHVLGAAVLGRNKAEALAEHLLSFRPQLLSAIAHATKVESFQNGDGLEGLLAADLVVLCTGHVGVESYYYDEIRSAGGQSPIAHAWLEPYAIAAHLLIVPEEGVTRGLLSDEFGGPNDAVTEWVGVSTEREKAGCGGSFQPYGVADMSSGISMMIEQVIATLLKQPEQSAEWVTSGGSERLKSLGGKWSASWEELTNALPDRRTVCIPHKA